MDRSLIYPGQIPLETDQLNQNRATMIAIGKLVAAVLGTGNIVSGLVVSPTSPAGLSVVVSPGEIYSLQNVDGAAYSSLPADTTHTCMKQGLSLDPVTLPCAAPTTAGFSTNYLIEATFQEVDGGAVVLPYYNASNPTSAFSGPGGSGNAQATLRQGKVVIQAKAGIAAASGTQATPAVDSGYVALAVVTVANGQTTITSGNIAAIASTSVLKMSVNDSVNANAFGRLLKTTAITASTTFVADPRTQFIRARGCGGGAAGGSTGSQGANQCSVGGGGGSGAWFEGIWTSGFASIPITIGSGGTPTTGQPGGNGGQTFLGSLAAAPGGGGGGTAQAATTANYFLSGQGGAGLPAAISGAVAGFVTGGNPAPSGLGYTGNLISGQGAGCPFGGGANNTNSGAGGNGTGYGSGGAGAATGQNAAGSLGGVGKAGIIIIEEYV